MGGRPRSHTSLGIQLVGTRGSVARLESGKGVIKKSEGRVVRPEINDCLKVILLHHLPTILHVNSL